MDLTTIEKTKNVATLLSDEQLSQVAGSVYTGYELDRASCQGWRNSLDDALRLAKQESNQNRRKSDVKYPLTTQAVIDFSSRIYPEIFKGDRVVKVAVLGNDPDESKAKRAARVGKHMSMQLMYGATDWEAQLDKFLSVFPLYGTVFKKVYYHPLKNQPVSDICLPDKLTINHDSESAKDARRITHEFCLSRNELVSRMRKGIYLDKEDSLKTLSDEDDDVDLLEQHCWIDLDDDGYQEPYIVVMMKEERTILSIAKRFKKVVKEKEKVIEIIPENYFIDYHFIPNPDGGLYSIGLGVLLYPINQALNTLINQLIDAGTLNNKQSGFISSGLRLKNGELQFDMGEFKVVQNVPGTSLQDSIAQLPTKEPSPTLFQLFGVLLEAGKDLVAVTDTMQGKGQTQNVPATTILALLEQSMRVHKAIYKRFYRSMKEEFERIYYLNQEHLKNADYKKMLDDPEADKDLDYADYDDFDICPVADPGLSSEVQRLTKAEAVRQDPIVDRLQATKFFLEAIQLEDEKIAKLLPQLEPNYQPPPNPEVEKLMAEVEKLRAETQEIIHGIQFDGEKLMADLATKQVDGQLKQAQVRESMTRADKMENDAALGVAKVRLVRDKQIDKRMVEAAVIPHQQEMDIREANIKELETLAKIQAQSEPTNQS